MKKKYFLYFLLAMLMGCKTGGPEGQLNSGLNQSMVAAFSKMVADKEFFPQDGTTFSESEELKFTFTDPSGLTFSTTSLCNPVKSEVKMDGVVMNFEPAVCHLVNVLYLGNGMYVNYGRYYFITTKKKDDYGRILTITFAFKGGRPENGVYQLDNNRIIGESNIIGPISEIAPISGEITVNNDFGFHISAPNVWTGHSGYSVINLSIGCCGR